MSVPHLYRTVPLSMIQFMTYVSSRRFVTFKKIDDYKEQGFTLELSKTDDYDKVWGAAEGVNERLFAVRGVEASSLSFPLIIDV